MRVINGEPSQTSPSPGSKSRLKQFRKNLSSDRDKIIFDDRIVDLMKKYAYSPSSIESILEYLNHLEDEDGYKFSQSLKQYSKLEQQIYKFAETNHTSFRWNQNYQKALKLVSNWIKTELKLRPLSYESDDDIREAIPKSTTHSGYTFIETGRRSKGENMDGSFARFSSALKIALRNGTFARPILPGTRTQGSGAFDDETGEWTGTCKHKTRLVSMIDLLVIIAELMFAKPFQERMSLIQQYAGGKNQDDISIIIQDWRSRSNYWYSLDYSSFDQTISHWLIQDAFKLIHDCFIMDELEEQIFGIIVHDFIIKDFITSEGVVHSEKGVPSGSMFTQIVDSIVNMLCIVTYLFSIGIPEKHIRMIVMGDDNLLFLNSAIDVELMASYLKKNFGLIMNPSKLKMGSCRRENPAFLSRVWKIGGQWRHPNVLVAKMAFPERFRPYDKEEVTPDQVLYGYHLSYKLGMEEIFNMEKFYSDHPSLHGRDAISVASHYVPGALRFNLEYLTPKTV